MSDERQALEAAMDRLRATVEAYSAGDAYGKTFVPGLSRAVEVVQRVLLERQEAAATATWARTMPGGDLTGRTRYRWHVEGWENDEWGMVASSSDTLPEAQKKQAGVARRVPGLTTRIVRETTTYTVEEQP